MKLFKMYLTEAQLKRLKSISDKTGAPMAALVRKAVDAYLRKVKP